VRVQCDAPLGDSAPEIPSALVKPRQESALRHRVWRFDFRVQPYPGPRSGCERSGNCLCGSREALWPSVAAQLQPSPSIRAAELRTPSLRQIFRRATSEIPYRVATVRTGSFHTSSYSFSRSKMVVLCDSCPRRERLGAAAIHVVRLPWLRGLHIASSEIERSRPCPSEDRPPPYGCSHPQGLRASSLEQAQAEDCR
jgi:hypothetical protein